MARGWMRLVAAVAATIVVSGGSTALAEEPERADGPTRTAGGTEAAEVVISMPDLGITHRLANGGMNLFRMPLSELEDGYGEIDTVRTLSTGGFSFDRSQTLTGDFGDLTPYDDGTADHIVWHGAADGSIRLWAIAGGADSTPRLWYTLRAPFTYANARPMVGDITGDGWEDLVVRLWRGCNGSTCYSDVWAFISNGRVLQAPRRLVNGQDTLANWRDSRNLLADVDGDGDKDWLSVVGTAGPGYDTTVRLSTGTTFAAPGGPAFSASGASLGFATTRTLAGDVTGDGAADLVTIARSGATGLAVWVQEAGMSAVQWQDLTSGGWSFAGSRQYLADTDADGALDLVSVHRSSGTGLLVWRHVSNGTSAFAAPDNVADLRTRGWNWSLSREGVADTIGVIVV